MLVLHDVTGGPRRAGVGGPDGGPRPREADLAGLQAEFGEVEGLERLICVEQIVACLPKECPASWRRSGRSIFNGMPFPRVRTRVVHQETALGFIAAGVGFTLLPESVSSLMPSSVRVARIAPPRPP